LRKAEIHDLNLMAFFSYCHGNVSQPQRKDRERHLFTIDGDEEDLHDEFLSNVKYKMEKLKVKFFSFGDLAI